MTKLPIPVICECGFSTMDAKAGYIHALEHWKNLPAYRPERAIAVLEEYASNPEDYDVYKVAEELCYLFGEQLAEERRKELVARP